MVVSTQGDVLAMSPRARRLHGLSSADQADMSAECYRQRFDLRHAEGGAPVDLADCLRKHATGENGAELPVLLRREATTAGQPLRLTAEAICGNNPPQAYLVTLAPPAPGVGSAESERLLRTVIEALPIGVWFTDRSGRIVLGNAAGQRIWSGIRHVGPEEYGQYLAWWAESGEPISPDEWGLARALRGESSLDEIIEIESFDGQRKIVRNWALPLHDEHGAIIGAVALNEDITDEWKANEQRERLAALVRSSTDAVVAKDRDGIITDWNPGAERMYGYSRSEAVGAPIGIIIPEDRAAEGKWLMELVSRGETLDQYETERIRKNGTRVSISLSLSPIRNALGRIVGAATISRDVTERKQDEARLREQARALELADRRKDDFIAILAHELRNPLAPIATAVDLIGLKDREGDYDEVVQIVRRQLGNMRRLLDDLLDVSRMGRGLLTVQKASIELRDAIRQAVETARPHIEQKQHVLELHVPEQPIPVLGDLQRLVQVFVNLLTNAARYTEPGGAISIHCTDHGDHVTVRVRDTGMGIPRHMLDRVFDLFRHPEPKDHAPNGLGLGLTLTRFIVEAHGGAVGAHSSGPGEGAEITVILPRLLGQPAVATQASGRETPAP